MKLFAVIVAGALLGGCATQIHAPKEANEPTKVKLGQYKFARIAPLKVERMEGDSGDRAGVTRIETSLNECMAAVFPGLKQAEGAGEGLLIEPVITDLKKVNSAERFWLGAMAGSSAVLLKTRYVDTGTGQVLAEPTFYARASAMSGAWTIGGADNAMLTRVTNEACGYAKQNS